MANGCKTYIEQGGLKQGDCLVLMYGADEAFRLHTHCEVRKINLKKKFKIGMRGINPGNMRGKQVNPVYIDFKDGTKYVMTYSDL